MSLGGSIRNMFTNALLVKYEEGPEIDLQVGRTVTKAPRFLRTELWLGVLQRHPGLGNAAARKYPSLLRKEVHPTTADDISKDVGRTFPNMRRFTCEAGKSALERVLRAYAAYDPEVNYCQGMNFVAAVLLIWLPREADAFGALVVLMQERGLRELYKSDMKALQARLWQISKVLPEDLAAHLENHAVLPVLYASSWLLTAFSADFPLFWSSRVLDVILTDCYIEPMMKVVLGIITTCKPVLMQSQDMEDMVRYIKANVPRWRHNILQEVLTDSLSMEWTPSQQTLLRQMEAEESVIQAVHRVNNRLQGASPSGEVAVGEGPSKRGSFKWAAQLPTAVALGPSKPSAKPTKPSTPPPMDLLDNDIVGRSEGDAREHSGDLQEGAEPQVPVSGFIDASMQTDDSAYAQPNSQHLKSTALQLDLPTHIEVQFSKHSSTGSFGDFTGSSEVEGLSQGHRFQISENARDSSTSKGPGGQQQGGEGSRTTQDGNTPAVKSDISNSLGDQNWWQSFGSSVTVTHGPPKTSREVLEKDASLRGASQENGYSDLDWKLRDEIQEREALGVPVSAEKHQDLATMEDRTGQIGPDFLNHKEVGHSSSATRSGVQDSMVDVSNNSSGIVSGSGVVDPFAPCLGDRSARTHLELTPRSTSRRLTKQESVNSKLEDELSKFTASLSIRDAQKLPMNSRKQQRHIG